VRIRLLYLFTVRMFGWLALLVQRRIEGRRDLGAPARVAVLRRQFARPRPDWADRAARWRCCCPGTYGYTGW
jgi:putative transposase